MNIYRDPAERLRVFLERGERPVIDQLNDLVDCAYSTRQGIRRREVAVYLLFRGKRVVYVGSSRLAIARIAAHVHDKDFDSFAVLTPTSIAEMLALERELIVTLDPEYNVMYAPSASVPCGAVR